MEIGDQFHEVYQAKTLCLEIDIDAERSVADDLLLKLKDRLRTSFRLAGIAEPDFSNTIVESKDDLYIEEIADWIVKIDGQHLLTCLIPLTEEVALSALDDNGLDARYEFDLSLMSAFRRTLKDLDKSGQSGFVSSLDRVDYLDGKEIYQCRFSVRQHEQRYSGSASYDFDIG